MSLTNTRAAYGWIAIALHWISAVGVTALYFLGERMEDAADRAEKIAARDLHVSVAMLLIAFLAARLFWTASQPSPRPIEQNRVLRIAAHAVQGLFLLMIAVLIVTGPLAVWSTGQPLQVFDLLAIPSPFALTCLGDGDQPRGNEAVLAAHRPACRRGRKTSGLRPRPHVAAYALGAPGVIAGASEGRR